MDSVSITSSIGELNAMLKKKKGNGKENKSMAMSKATRSTAAMSNLGGHESFHRGQN